MRWNNSLVRIQTATAILPPAAAATATATAYRTFIHPLQCQEPQASVRQSVQPWASQEEVSQCESVNLRTDVRLARAAIV